MIKTNIIYSFLLIFIISCNDDAPPFEIQRDFATINAEVSVCNLKNDPGCDTLQPVPGARIWLFESEDDRFNEKPIYKEGTTGGSGKVTFNNLEAQTYFLLTVSQYGRVESAQKVSLRAIAQHPVVFYTGE